MHYIRVDTDLQQLVATIEFDKVFAVRESGKSGSIEIVGTARINGALNLNGHDLVIDPTFGTFRICKLKINQIAIPGPVVSFINGLLGRFRNNINGTLRAQRIALEPRYVADLNPEEFLHSLPGVHDITGNDIEFTVEVDRGAVLVDHEGVHVLAKFTEGENPVRYDTFKATKPVPGESVSSAFESYKGDFLKFANRDLGSDVEELWPNTSALVSKQYTAGLINNSLGNLSISAGFGLEGISGVPLGGEGGGATTLHFEPAPDLNCEVNAAKKSCDIQMGCSQVRDCTPHWNCSDCAWYDGYCHAVRGACELDKVRYRTQCEGEKEVARQGCEADKARLRAQCEAQKAIDLAGCNANQTWLSAWSGANFGQLDGTVDVGEIDARAGVMHIGADPELQVLTANTEIEASANIKVDFVFTPLDAGHLLCQVPWGGPVRVRGGFPPQALGLSAGLHAAKQENGGLILEFETAEQTLKLSTSPPPIVAIVSQNPQFFIACSPAAILGVTGSLLIHKFQEQLVVDTFDFKLPSQRLPMRIDPLSFKIMQNPVKLAPEWRDRSIGFRMISR